MAAVALRAPLKQFLRDPLDYQLRARARYGDVFRSRIGLLAHFLYHPDHVRHVLQDDSWPGPTSASAANSPCSRCG